MMSVWKPLSMVLVISFKVVMSWDSQDLPGRKPCCCSHSIFSDSK